MKIVILDYCRSLRHLAEDDSRITSQQNDLLAPAEVCALASAEGTPFVLFWHKDARSAIKLIRALEPDWPRNLCGCVFYSSQPKANALATYDQDLDRFEAAKRGLPKTREKFVHFLESGVPDDLNPEEHSDLLGMLRRFRNYVLKLDYLTPVSFSLLEPSNAPAQEDGEEKLKARLKYLTASDRRRETKLSPVAIDCPTCQRRAAVHHPLQRIQKAETPNPSDLLELLGSNKGKSLVLALTRSGAEKEKLVTHLLKRAHMNAADLALRKEISRRIEKVFDSCTVLNLGRSDQALELLETIGRHEQQPIELLKLIPKLEECLKCPCQTGQRVML